MRHSHFWSSWLFRPSVWVGLVSILAYWDETSLHGSWVYDDSGSVAKNVVVTGHVPWREAFTRDYWGTSMSEISSHKSFRPVTTLSFRLNWIYNEHTGAPDGGLDTHSYRLVNLFLHGIVSILVTETSSFVFDEQQQDGSINTVAQLITGFLFALHPVHTEVVSNVTSRGELLMSIFFLMAFLSFASHLPTNNNSKRIGTFRSVVAIYIIPFLGMFLSLFSKEQGATTLISLVVYDFCQNHVCVEKYLEDLLEKRDAKAIAFLRRTLILAVQTVLVCGFRYWLNGETSPDFIFDQNPAGFSEDRFTRAFSVSWVYCLYVLDAVFPKYLCPDWSGRSIDLITDGSDKRIWAVLALWAFGALCTASMLLGPPEGATKFYKECRRVTLMAFFAFLFSPFLLSSNILVVVGLMKADRVIYLPLLGFCLMEALLFKGIFTQIAKTKRHAFTGSLTHWLAYSLIMLQLGLLTAKLHERNHAWSNSLSLWLNAYKINPRSHHTMYNCGYELSLKQRYEEAEHVLRPIGNPRVDGPSNTFVYVMVLYNMGRCDEAIEYMDEAKAVLDEKRAAGGARNLPHMLDRTESNLMVARAHCTEDIADKGRLMYDAVQKDQTNPYAVQQAQSLMERIDTLKKLQEQQPNLKIL